MYRLTVDYYLGFTNYDFDTKEERDGMIVLTKLGGYPYSTSEIK